MEFEEIAKRLNMSEKEVKRLYKSAMTKLKIPSEINKKLWSYQRYDLKNEDSGETAYNAFS